MRVKLIWLFTPTAVKLQWKSRLTKFLCPWRIRDPGIPDIELAMQEGWSTAKDEVRNLGFGAGMGLPNMKKYTDSMELTSTVGVGTTVRMSVSIA